MKDSPTLADSLLRETLRPHTTLARVADRPIPELRAALLRARRFVLDSDMSAFMADLSLTPFKAANARVPALIDSIRHGARIPHATTWIEYDQIAFRRRQIELGAEAITGGVVDDYDQSPRIGWLLEQHPQVETVVKLAYVVDISNGVVPGVKATVVPMSWVWQTTDEPIPWKAHTESGSLAVGVAGYRSSQVGVVFNDWPIRKEERQYVKEEWSKAEPWHTHFIVVDTAGMLRHVICLLATLNDVPVILHEVKQQRGFVARGNYRKFLDHTIVRLNIPVRKDRKILARQLIAIARCRRHGVRGHWRLYQRGSGALCLSTLHEWEPQDAVGHAKCHHCSAWRTWIAEHERGDALLGYSTHEYRVGHAV